MGNTVEQAKIVTTQAAIVGGQDVTQLALFNQDGSAFSPGGLDATGAQNAIKNKTQIQAVTTTAAANATAAAGANPTKAEYDVVVTLVNELKGDLNALIAALKA